MDYKLAQFQKPIKLIITDMDGTLLNANHEVSPRSFRAVEAATKAGIGVVLASGRAFFSVGPTALSLGLKGPQISLNGGLVAEAESGKIHHIHPLSPSLIARILGELEQRRFKPIIFAQSGMYATENGPETELITSYGEPPINIISWPEMFHIAETIKILIIAERGEIDEQLRSVFGEGITTIRTGSLFLEFQPPGITKGLAVKELLSEYKISPDEIMVFGDNDNDASMLALTPHSFAVENATTLAKNASRYRAPSNTSDGVAEVIEAYLGQRFEY